MKEGWTYKKLGEVGTFIRGGGFLKKDYVENGIPCIHYGQIHTILGTITQKHITSIPENLRNKTRFASKGDIIFAITSEDVEGSCKCTAWLGDYDVAVGGHAAIYKHSLYPAFVSYFAKSSLFYKQKEKYVHGFKVMEIKPSDIAQIEIPVPPLSEQQRIVERLDTAFAHIDELKEKAEKQLSEARALFQSALTKAMEPKEGWEEKTLNQIGVTQTGTTPSKDDKANYGDYIPFIRPSEIDFDGCGNIDYDSEMKLSEKGVSKGRLFKAGSILMVCIGATISKVGYLTKDVSCNQQINVLTPQDDNDFKFVYYAMRNKDFKDKVIKEGTSSQATLPIINKGKWEKLSIYLPPLSEQQRIVSRLDSLSENVRKYEEIQRKIVSECDALKQALLRKVFE